MSAGLAMEGYIPYVNTIATFLTRRCYEQIAIDLCLHNLPVRLIGSGGGLVYAPLGPTHQAIEDIAIMRALPNMTVLAVSDAKQMTQIMPQTLDWVGPIYIRLGRGGEAVVPIDGDIVIGKAVKLREPKDALLVTTGVMLQHSLAAAELLAARGIRAGVLHVHTLKPFDANALLATARGIPLIVCVEEHTAIGGLGSAVADTLLAAAMAPSGGMLHLSLPDAFVKKYGSQEKLLTYFGLNAESIARRVQDALGGAAKVKTA
jgi:transketolase